MKVDEFLQMAIKTKIKVKVYDTHKNVIVGDSDSLLKIGYLKSLFFDSIDTEDGYIRIFSNLQDGTENIKE